MDAPYTPPNPRRPDRHRLHELAERAEMTVDELAEFLDSPTGRRLRGMFATGLIVSVPLVMRIPGLRRSPVGRLIEVTGGAAIVMAVADAIRDWERGEKARHRRATSVIEVPPVEP
jgi:hypothetical protein